MQNCTFRNQGTIDTIAVVSSMNSRVRFQLRRIGVPFKMFDDFDALGRYCEESKPAMLLIAPDKQIAPVIGRVLNNSRSYDSRGILILAIDQIETENSVLNLVKLGVTDVVSAEAVDLELIARIRAVIYRAKTKRNEHDFWPYLFNVESQQLFRGGGVIETTGIEFKLALFLFSNPNVVHSREYLLDQVWGISVPIDSRRVDTHISRLRSKLGLNGEENQWYLMSVYVRGYMLTEKQLANA